jgi:hypothetical protein
MRSTTAFPLFALALAGLVIGLVVGPVPGSLAAPNRAAPAAKKPKYYFKVIEVKSATADDVTKATAMKLLEAELSGRPEFTPDLPGATDPDTVAFELRARKLQGFKVTMDIQSLKQDTKPPRAGGRLPQLAVGVRVSVFGTTIPEAKLAFGGDGEATIEAEFVERRRDEEAASLTKDVLAQAIKQAVDQAVAKLSQPKSKPFNESKKRRKLT